VLVADETAGGADISREELHRVIRALVDAPQGRARPVKRIRIIGIVVAVAAPVVLVAPLIHELVPP